MSSEKAELDVEVVRHLVATQFPQWAQRSIRPVEVNGWDNNTFRLGDDMSVRLPSAEGYVLQVEKEQYWLPRLAALLPLPIPVPIAAGHPDASFPWPWSIYRWLDGEVATAASIANMSEFATTLAHFLTAFHQVDATDGLPPGPHNYYRGGSLTVYDQETRNAIAHLEDDIDVTTATEVWEAAVRTEWSAPPVWVHGDVSPGNLLVKDGRLSAVIDFGCLGVGDPACDLAIAWTFFSGESREAFQEGLRLDGETWARGRGWALWKTLIVLAGQCKTNAVQTENCRAIIDAIFNAHQRFA